MFLAVLQNAKRLLRTTGSSVLPVWVFAHAVELGALIALGAFHTDNQRPSPALTLGLVALLALTGAFQHGLFRPLRMVTLQHVVLGPRAVAFQALRRMLPVLAVMELVNLATAASALLSAIIGPKVTFFPEIVVFFTLTPAIYICAARQEGIFASLNTALGWQRVPRYALLLFGAQGLLLGLAVIVQNATSALLGPEHAPFGVSFAAISMYGLYRFFQWLTLSAVFLTIDNDES